MCNLYDVGPAPRNKRFAWEKDLARLLDDLKYVAPGKPGLIAMNDGGEVVASRAAWGFQRKFPGKGGMVEREVNNARDDKLEGRMWGKAFRERRCVIPVRQLRPEREQDQTRHQGGRWKGVVLDWRNLGAER